MVNGSAQHGMDDDDPWTGVSREDLQGFLDEYLTESKTAPPLSGRMWLPRRKISIGRALVALVSDNVNRASASKAELEASVEDVFPRYFDEPPRWVVKCSNPDSRVSGIWGLVRLRLGERGYICHKPDEGDMDESLRIAAAWEPVDDAEVWKACFLAAYAREWAEIGLPPLMGQCAVGPDDLMVEAIVRALASDGTYWNQVADTSRDGGWNGLPGREKVGRLSNRAGVPLELMERIVGQLKVGDAVMLTQIQNGDLQAEERRAVVAIFLDSIEGDPFA
jgi:hypothetical protein